MIDKLCVCVFADSESDRLSLDITDDTSDETLLNSIDKLSDACFMRLVSSCASILLVVTQSVNLSSPE